MRSYFGNGFEEDGLDYYYTKDHLGSIREVVAADGTTIHAVYDYSPWGEVTKIGYSNIASDFLYTGHYFHASSDLFLTHYRAYDPELGKWLSRDPIAENGGINLYAYVGNNPIMRFDPLGLRWYHDAAIGALNVAEGGLNAVSGFADTATFGFTDWASNELNDLIYGEEISDEAERRRKCSKMYKAGSIAGMVVPVGGGVAGAARLAGPGSKLLGTGSKLLGKKGILNSNDIFRYGWGTNKGTPVFRAVVGGFRTKAGRAISNNIPGKFRHLDFF